MTGVTFPSSIDRPWSWRCTNCDLYGPIQPDEPNKPHWTDIVLFVFERHWHRRHMIELWPTGERHHGVFAWRDFGAQGSPVVVGPSTANTTHRDYTGHHTPSTND